MKVSTNPSQTNVQLDSTYKEPDVTQTEKQKRKLWSLERRSGRDNAYLEIIKHFQHRVVCHEKLLELFTSSAGSLSKEWIWFGVTEKLQDVGCKWCYLAWTCVWDANSTTACWAMISAAVIFVTESLTPTPLNKRLV